MDDDDTRRVQLLSMTIEEELISMNATHGLGLNEDQVNQLTEGIVKQVSFRSELRWKGLRPGSS